MGDALKGKRIAFLATGMVEQVELTEPWKAVKDAGGTPELISIAPGEIQGFSHYDKANTFRVDKTVEEASASVTSWPRRSGRSTQAPRLPSDLTRLS